MIGALRRLHAAEQACKLLWVCQLVASQQAFFKDSSRCISSCCHHADDIVTALEPPCDANRLPIVGINPLSLYWQEHDNRTVAA